MNSATRFLVGGLAVVVVLTAVAGADVVWQTGRAEQSRTLQKLQVAATVESELQANRLDELQLHAELLAHDSAFVDYVAQSLIPDPRLGGAIDKVSISDLLQERRHGYDISMVLDPHGVPMAASGVLFRKAADVQTDPLVTGAIQAQTPTHGTWIDDDRLLWVAVNPLVRGGALQGVLVTAARVDGVFADAVSRIAHTGILFMTQSSANAPSSASSHVDSWVTSALTARLPSLLKQTEGKRVELVDTGRHATAWVTPLVTADSRAVMISVAADTTLGNVVHTDASPLLLGVGVLGIIGVLLVLLQWQRTRQSL